MDVDNSDGETQTKPSSSKLNPAASINSKKNSIDESSSSSSSKLNPSDNQSSCNVKSESERTLNLNTPSTSALKDKDDLCNLNKNSVCNSTATTTTVSVNNTSGSEIKTEIEIKEELDEAAGRSTINTVLPPHAVSKFGVSCDFSYLLIQIFVYISFEVINLLFVLFFNLLIYLLLKVELNS